MKILYKNYTNKMEKSVVITTTCLYTSEEGDLCLQSNPVRKRKGRPRK